MVDAADAGQLDVLWSSGGNFLEVLPDPRRVERALQRVRLRVHQDVIVSPSMLVDPAPGGEVLLLPVATRYEQEGGGTETTTERRIIYSPEIPGHRVGEARDEFRVFADVVARVRPDLAQHVAWRDAADLRREIGEVVPLYAGIERLARSGDQVQYGGRHLAPEGRFPTPSGRGRFSPVRPTVPDLPPGRFTVSTRRGRQFNSMVQGAVDPLNGAARDDVLMDRDDAAALGLAEGDPVVLRSPVGAYRGRVRFARLARRSLQVHWPEGNVLIESGPEHREPGSKTPDYNAVVTVERAGTPVAVGS
jgi:predicted molibdopterin-dependent oxidoreductase YjgC